MAVRLYRARAAKAGEAQPALVYFHGGGWVIGSLESHDGVCRELANRRRTAPCCRSTIAWRPSTSFRPRSRTASRPPQWVCGECRDRSASTATAWPSAATAPAAISRRSWRSNARDRGTPKLCFQLLIYPACDMGDDACRRSSEFAEQLPLTRSTMKWFIDLYLRGPRTSADWKASPLKASEPRRVCRRPTC